MLPLRHTPLGDALALLLLAALSGCASPQPRAPLASAPHAALGESIDADAAAARALQVSPRVRAAALRLEAAQSRAAAAALPPDPSIALGLGIPIDGMGGTGISLSIMQGIGWLLAGDAIRDAAARERDVAARELVAASVETAAEARRLVRTVCAARATTSATHDALDARGARASIERALVELGETNSVEVLRLEREALAAQLELVDAELEEHELTVSLASLLSVETLPTLVDAAVGADAVPSAQSLEVIRARAAVARAEAMLATADSPLGADARVGGGVMQDVEDRRTITGSLEFGLPIFRRPHELAALRAELLAARAELAEAERIAALENDHALVRVKSARETEELARTAAASAHAARLIAEKAQAVGERSFADLAEARLEEADTAIGAAERRIELANALAKLESRAIPPHDAAHRTFSDPTSEPTVRGATP